MKKQFFAVLLSSLMLFTSIGSIALASGNDTDSGVLRKLTTQQIKQSALDKLNDIENDLEVKPLGSFYEEWPVSYLPDYQFVDKEAFQVAEFTFDTYGHNEEYKTVDVIYTGGDTVSWTIAGALEGEAEFKVIKAKLGISVSRTSTISTSVSAKAPYSIKKDSVGVIPIYAYGYKTGGAIKYKWADVAGNTGYKYKDIESYLPYTKYTDSYIKFGRLIYE
ncbi:hypothetical protein [Brassicibacter mesophilus]|uniref:hypothetical protein n=1 Tax=Brassicibacter mesophilus TaxID=745119 RepID=UPI003D19636D